jgi:hypothetical protein
MVKAMYLPQFSLYLGKITEKRQYKTVSFLFI